MKPTLAVQSVGGRAGRITPSSPESVGVAGDPNRLRRQRIRRAVGVLASIAIALSLVVAPDSVAAAPTANGGWLHTAGSAVVTESGADFTIKAVNWFGLETATCAPHGLWQISLDQAMDQIASFGFNTIRLPYSSECIAGTAAAVSGIDTARNPALLGLTPLQIMDKVVAAASARNLRVILDRHRPDSASQSELWYTDRYSEQQWIADWVMLATRYAANPTVIGADLQNEPRGKACWGCGDPAVDWAAAATRAGSAVLTANPHLLILVEGVEKQALAGTTWWGGGLADVAVHPITLSVPAQLVYSAHDYPASIGAQSWFSASNYPANLPALWDKNWGYLQKKHIAPVLLGEFGTKLATKSDTAWLNALVSYLGANHMGFAYWAYNPNSADTGGLVADDWRTPQRAKLDALAPLLSGSTAAPTPAPMTVPAAPTIGAAGVLGANSATVTWTAPVSDGGSVVTGYSVQVSNAVGGAQIGALRAAGAAATSLTVSGLTSGSAIRFQVKAINRVGTGPLSGVSNTVTPVPTAPGAPLIGVAMSGVAGGTITATANWGSAAANGSAVTGYRVTAVQVNAAGTVLSSTSSAVRPAAGRSLQMTLAPGTYRFTSQAINAVGAGPQSGSSNLVTAR